MMRRPETPNLICASHTISGTMPGKPARHPFAERVQAVAEAGFDGLTIHFRDHQHLLAGAADPGALRDCVAAAGLTVSEVEFLSDWHRDPLGGSVRQAIKTAHLFGARRINVGADLAGLNIPLSDLVEPFRRLTGAIGEAGLTTALEVIAWGTVGSVPRAVDLLGEARGPAGLLLDNWHLAALGGGPSDLPDPSLVAGLQISDALRMSDHPARTAMDATLQRLFPGEGQLDIPAFLGALWSAALRCGVTVEVISADAAEAPVRHCAMRAADTARQVLAQATPSSGKAASHV
ncbi:sugar phosphate isomerase/epimerase family protein [Thalassorhabdomicrobium marinisediminis]|nr:TIM barrel protein [Thalassorhabdomicrobium marinisediminis]